MSFALGLPPASFSLFMSLRLLRNKKQLLTMAITGTIVEGKWRTFFSLFTPLHQASFLIFLRQRLLQQISRLKSDNWSYYHPQLSSLPLWQMSLQFSAQCANVSPSQTLVAVRCAAENSILGANLQGKWVLASFGRMQKAASCSILLSLNHSHVCLSSETTSQSESDTSKELLFFFTVESMQWA